VTFHKEEGMAAQLDGFTITNGEAIEGGGIYCVNAYPRVVNCIITENSAGRGGGIYCESLAAFVQNRIIANEADEGGGLFMNHASPVLESNIFAKNSADAGGGLYCYADASPCIMNCTLYNNSVLSAGGGLFCVGSTPSVKNSIFWMNSALFGPEINIYSGSVTVSHSDFTEGWSGEGNMAEDPQFLDPIFLDLHLAFTSPCINRGSNEGIPELDVEGEARLHMGTVDMGADECTETLPLECDTFILPESTGGSVNFTLNGGEANAWQAYLLLGSVSGTLPGFPLPGGKVSLRLNWDIFTEFVVALLNTTAFYRFLNHLDVDGWSYAQLNTGPLPPGYAGLEIDFAYCLGWPWEFVSNPMRITIE
ncbi:MAG: choice-of-anchor Q domain-containing protein, partial [Planctomycetota bacterium]